MRVFISHGLDKHETGQSQYLDDLEAALRAPTPEGVRHEVLVDRTRLEAGDDWNGVLLDCLDECDRALLLLTERALARPWVWREATILDFRHRRRDGFRLYPVALGEGVREQLPGVPALAALRLDDIQWMPAGATPAEVARTVHEQLDAQPQPGANQLVRVAEAMAAHLRDADGGQLDVLLQELAAPLAFDAGTDARRRRALGLARAVVGGRLGAQGLPGLLRRLVNECALPPPARDALRELAAPLWVASEAASALGRHCAALQAAAPEQAAALYATRRRYSGRMLVHRHLLPVLPQPGLDVVLPLAGGYAGRGFDEIEADLLKTFSGVRGSLAPADARDVLIAAPETYFALLAEPLPAPADLARLRDTYPGVVFIAHPGALQPDELPPEVVPLPALDEAAIKQNYTQFISAGGRA